MVGKNGNPEVVEVDLISVDSPVPISRDEIVLVCDHLPLENWTHFERGEIVAEFDDGTEISPDHIALCNACFALDIHEVQIHAACIHEKNIASA